MEDKSREPIIDSTTGERICPVCYVSLGFPMEYGDSFFDDDDESIESASDVEFTFIAEGDRIQDSTTEQKRVNDRKESFRKAQSSWYEAWVRRTPRQESFSSKRAGKYCTCTTVGLGQKMACRAVEIFKSSQVGVSR